MLFRSGATIQERVYQFGGGWKLSHQDPVNDQGKKPKPVVKDLAVKGPFVVLDARVPSLIVLAADRVAGQSAIGFVRVDNASSGQLAVARQALVAKNGDRFERVSLRADNFEVSVLRDAAGKLVSVRGVEGWRALIKDRAEPRDLQAVELAAPATTEAP